MFISVLEFVSLMVLFMVGRISFLDIIYSLISLGGTPLIYHLGMEANRNNDIAHAKNSLKIFEKKKSKNESEEDQSQRQEIKDDVRTMNTSEEKDVDDHGRIQEELPSSSSSPRTKDQAPPNVDPEPEEPTHNNQQKLSIAVSAKIKEDVRVIDISEEKDEDEHIPEEHPSSSSSTSTKASSNVEPEPEKPSHMNQRREIKDDVMVVDIDISAEKDVDNHEHIPEEVPSGSSTRTKDKTPSNIEPEPEKPTHMNQRSEIKDDVKDIDLSEEKDLSEDFQIYDIEIIFEYHQCEEN